MTTNAERDTSRIEFTTDQIDRLGHWLSECLDDAAPLNERIWRSRAAWMANGPTFQAVLREVIDARVTSPAETWPDEEGPRAHDSWACQGGGEWHWHSASVETCPLPPGGGRA